MTEFLALYHASKAAKEKFGEMSSEEMSKTMEAWMKWAQNCGEHLIDMVGGGLHLAMENILKHQVPHQVVLRLEDTPSCKQTML